MSGLLDSRLSHAPDVAVGLSESERLDRVRRDFVANVSHELKTPVATIRALAETAATALDSDDLESVALFIDRLGAESARLAGLVTDLLDLSRLEAGLALRPVEVGVDAFLTEAADHARSGAEEKGLTIAVQPSSLKIDVDPSQFAMALENLVDNAVRYSEQGEIRLSAEADQHSVTIAIADEGIGIPEHEIPRIFERFYRVDKARSRATGGTGLGLAIVKHVVENHGGEVEVRSAMGAGTTVMIRFPRGTKREPGR